MKLKLDESGNAVLSNGMPVYIREDGTESPLDAAAMVNSVRDMKQEVKTLKQRAEQAEGAAKLFEGLDPEKARKALELTSNLDAKKLVDAGQVEQVKAEVSKVYEAKLAEVTERAAKIEKQFHQEVVGGAFARSKFLAEKTVLPADLAQAAFGNRFVIEDGKLKATGPDGQPIFSKVNPGAPADFDEAIEILVEQYPRKDAILRADNRAGSGSPAGGGPNGAKTINRAAFDALDPAGKQAHISGGGKVTD